MEPQFKVSPRCSKTTKGVVRCSSTTPFVAFTTLYCSTHAAFSSMLLYIYTIIKGSHKKKKMIERFNKIRKKKKLVNIIIQTTVAILINYALKYTVQL